jgi:hypothetical protein
MRRIFFQVSLLCGFITFAATLWRALATGTYEILQASVRAVGSGMAILVFAMLIFWVIEKLGGTPTTNPTPALPLIEADDRHDLTHDYEEGN